ncbi:MAG: protein kinase [Anaerolineaceae bacterium]|nr:protein kinase [Anaerolineaceae bacterium]
MEDLTGRQFGPYHITAPLGAGGMAAVYKAYQPSVDRFVAVKVLPQHFAKDQQFVQRFEREAKVLAKLQHPNILPVYDYGQTDGYTYLVMSFVESGDLSELMQGKRLPLPEISRIITQVGDALDYAHAQGVVHRDIKPSNILVDQRGNCLLTDFGLAKMVAGASEKLTATGFVVGTPAYMAPEQGLGEPADGRSDIYALGIILYELMTGQVPFQAETPIAVVMKHIHDPLISPRNFQADISEPVERVILKALAKNPEDRFATAGDMVRAFQAAINTTDPITRLDPIHPTATHISKAKPPVAKPSTQPPRSGSGLLWVAGGLAALVLIGMVALGVWLLLAYELVDDEPAQAAPIAAPTQPPPPPTAALPSPTVSLPTQAPIVPTATATQVVPPTQPAAEPTQPALPEPSQLPTQPPPSPGDAAPVEAIAVCQGLAVGNACRFTPPIGPAVEGQCQQIRNQLACVPAGAPPPLR